MDAPNKPSVFSENALRYCSHPWRGRFTLLPVFTLQYRVVEVCQQSEKPRHAGVFVCLSRQQPTINRQGSCAALQSGLGDAVYAVP
ncbi:hypothetical protein DJ62_2417 [Yersinia enterocolitica]|nr:hypothetical protein DJ62_2417 [Yersinia enterocolitica]